MLGRLIASAMVTVLTFGGIVAAANPAAGEEATALTPSLPAVDRTATDGALWIPTAQTPGTWSTPPPVFDADVPPPPVYPNASYVVNGVTPVQESTRVSPSDGATNVPLTVTLVGGASGMAPGGDGFGYEYEYKVCRGTARSCSGENLLVTSPWVKGGWAVPAGILAAGTTYSWEASVRNSEYGSGT